MSDLLLDKPYYIQATGIDVHRFCTPDNISSIPKYHTRDNNDIL